MNIYAIIILITLIFSFLLDIITNILNLRALRSDVPEEFTGVYDAEKYRKSQEYTRVRTTFGLFTGTLSLSAMLIFWFAGGFNYLDQLVRSWHLPMIGNGLIYIACIMFARFLLTLPFSIYSTFVIEDKFGFNKTTPRLFVVDTIKSIVLSLLIGVPLLAGLLYFFNYAGEAAWFYCWGATTLFILFLQFIAPTWIMPLFNKFTPLEEGELKEAIETYAAKVKYPLKGLFVMDGSKRSTKSNAFFTGFGKNKRIALFDTLIAKHTVPELVGVLAHEIGHYKKKHIFKGMVIGILHTGILFYLLSIFLTHEGLFAAFYMEQSSVYTGLIFFGMLYAPIELILSVIMQLFSRKNEYEADHFAAETTRNIPAFISALKKLSVDNLSNLTPHPFYVFLNYSHPPVLQRIKRLERYVA
jgi:STE24 endopeptidase